MLTTLREILGPARKEGYAVPGFDCAEDVMVRAILETAEQLRSPVAIMCLEGDLQGNGWHYIPGLVRAVAAHHDIPIALHLDHATDLDMIRRAVDAGFSSVMIDGSSLPFEENVRLTKAAADLAKPRGLSLEGELGHVGGADLEATGHHDSVFTEPEEILKFVELTGVDALAVSIGTAHGVYEAEPQLNIERLKELNAISPIPLVLHGGSGTPDDQIRDAICNGICKLNIFADSRIAMACGLRRSAEMMTRPDPLPTQLFGPIKEEVAQVAAQKIALFGSANRV